MDIDASRIKEKDLKVDWILQTWRKVEGYKILKPAMIFGPILSMFLFSTFISNDYGNLIAFATLNISVLFLIISIWMLVWILK